MATRLDVPQLGLTMETGTILQWVKAEGDKVEKGQPVVVIQTTRWSTKSKRRSPEPCSRSRRRKGRSCRWAASWA